MNFEEVFVESLQNCKVYDRTNNACGKLLREIGITSQSLVSLTVDILILAKTFIYKLSLNDDYHLSMPG